jgi:hypothetical protein
VTFGDKCCSIALGLMIDIDGGSSVDPCLNCSCLMKKSTCGSCARAMRQRLLLPMRAIVSTFRLGSLCVPRSTTPMRSRLRTLPVALLRPNPEKDIPLPCLLEILS